MYDSFDNTYQVRRPLTGFIIFDYVYWSIPIICASFFPFFQATIGIDFLSKTMYLEDRTVSVPVAAVVV